MRAANVIRLCVLLVVVGVVLAFVRKILPGTPATTPSTSTVLPVSPPPPPPPLGPPLETVSQKAFYQRTFERRASSVPATAGLACVQDALGGVKVLAGVTSLRIVANTKPGRREIAVVFPDRYEQSDIEKDASPGAIRLRLVREVLMRLPRELTGVQLLQRTMLDAGQQRLAIDASGLDGLDITLLADPGTCLPVALEYRQPSTAQGGSDTYRVELSQYRRFGGILFATALRTTKNGGPWEDEYVSEIHVNGILR